MLNFQEDINGAIFFIFNNICQNLVKYIGPSNCGLVPRRGVSQNLKPEQNKHEKDLISEETISMIELCPFLAVFIPNLV